MRFLLGGYTADMKGNASGIGMLHAGAADDALAGGPLSLVADAAVTDGSPSWLARHPSLDVVYAALEGAGTVQAFRRTGESSFAAHGAPVAAGELVCHVTVAPDGGSLIAACWGDGRIVRMSLDAVGRPSAPEPAATAVDPYGTDSVVLGFGGSAPAGDIDLAAAARALREAAGAEFAHLVPDHEVPEPPAAGADPDARPSRSHQSVFLPGGLIATTDMGLDLVRFWRAGASGLRLVQQLALPRGSGPRHTVWHPSGHLYVVTELSCEVFALAPTAEGTWRIVGGAQLSPATIAGVDLAAELAASRDGEFLYAGVRGSNTLATLRVRGGGESLEPVALVESGVDWPRHHVVVRDTLLVAGQLSDEVAALTLDQRTGVPARARRRVTAGSPTCLLPLV
ncbi:lactonase family protein [Microbacterium terricola]|uniref:3-carboxymuconate cyclase n=1 Tax=Microbacterium terricola TaxID=344163 RepID=A0ABM8DUX0_9MICO|nr:lactonase family protein [Microbacterium terricola]UYK39837.1 lactonase family protein [Microbacterium terricola]BDV29411.1 hypothetical protein Microterr_00710 [Microbacterium terricola]